ncbi:anosmin-1b [Latimeria chalumnae]|uniref:anosmin-1b n=1 Tax=Latimeria chalumnae TaxID=7897 RepID=UPI00313E7E36
MYGRLCSGCCAFFLCLVAALAARRAAEDVEKIRAARCASRCLALHITQLAAAFKSLQNDDILTWCENNRRCSQCLQPCKEWQDTGRYHCPRKCEKQHECVTSCEFLKSIQTAKQGDCPPPQKASGFAAACVQGCSEDKECPGIKKCCSNGCGYTCQTPANMYKGVPLKPRKSMAFVEDKKGILEVSWISKFNVSVEPVFYILQRRWNHGIHPSEDESTEWQSIAMTTEDHVRLKDTRPNRWYQFRVAAINVHGTRGFTTPSKHFHSSRDPLPPNAPKNLRKGNFTTGRDGTLSVIIYWDLPQEEDLPIHHYKVFWSQWVSRKAMLQTKKNNWKITEGVKLATELNGLHPNVEYLVQVQAVAFWDQKRLKSAKSLIVFNTPHIDVRSNYLSSSEEVSNELPTFQTTSNIKRIEAAAPHFHDNQLQVKVYWKKDEEEISTDSNTYLLTWVPVICSGNNTRAEETVTVQGNHFIITKLLFACKYKVTVQPVTVQDQALKAVTFVTTPQCSSVKAKGSKRLHCAREGRHHMSRKVILRPEKLTAAFKIVNGSIRGEFHWQVLQSHPSQQSVTGYQFSWTEVPHISKQKAAPDTVISQMQILPNDQPFVSVDNLRPLSFYQVRVQVLSIHGKGPATVKTFQVPQINAL